MKMGEEILTFDNIEVEKNGFYLYTDPIFPKNVRIEKVLVSNKFFFVEKL